jgi:hypothetical protein
MSLRMRIGSHGLLKRGEAAASVFISSVMTLM